MDFSGCSLSCIDIYIYFLSFRYWYDFHMSFPGEFLPWWKTLDSGLILRAVDFGLDSER